MRSSPIELLTDSLVADLARRPTQVGWRLTLVPDAREAGGCFISSLRGPRPYVLPGCASDPGRSAQEAARRARSKARRYCAANRLNRLGTLTYRGAGCHDPKQLRRDVAAFWIALRRLLGGSPFPYLWTAEWHKSGHGLHVHFAVGRYIKRNLIEAAWPHGFVHIKQLNDLPVGSGAVDEARVTARYLAKYVGKDFDGKRLPGFHRYEVAEGFRPKELALWGRTRDEVVRLACIPMGGDPAVLWTSDQHKDWQGPPALWLQWAG